MKRSKNVISFTDYCNIQSQQVMELKLSKVECSSMKIFKLVSEKDSIKLDQVLSSAMDFTQQTYKGDEGTCASV